MQTRWLVVCAVLLGILFLVVLVVPFFVNADTFRPVVESKLTNALGRNVNIGRLSFSLFGSSLVADDIAIADDPSFSSVPFVQAKKLNVGVEMMPLLFHREVRITKLAIDTPSIQMIQHANGKWNFSSLSGSSPSPGAAQTPGSIPDLSVDELKITNGSATVSSIPVTAKPFEYTNLNLTIKHFSFLKSFPFDLSASLPAGGTLKLNGDAGPISQTDASHSPFQAKLELRNFDPVAAGVIDQSKGVSTVADVDAQLKSDGTNVASTGKIKASRLKLAPSGSPAQLPVDIDYALSENLVSRQGTVSDIGIHAGTATVHTNGSFQVTPQAFVLNLHTSAPGLPIDQVESLLPIVGIRVPSGSSLKGGTLTANINITGPSTAVVLTGPVQVENTTLAGFDLGSKIQGLNPLGGTGAGTQIQVLKANVNSSPEGTKLTDILGNLPQIGSATGEGTVAPSGAINFNLTAKLSSSNIAGAAMNTAGAAANRELNSVGGTAGSILGGFLHSKSNPAASLANRGIPLTITGTATNPSIHANVGAMLR
jgi:AsmA protein